MHRSRGLVVLTLTLLALCVWGGARSTERTAATAPPRTAQGVVFHDANGNQRRDEDETPLSGIRVSNGEEIVVTDEAGRYELPVDEDAILFVIKPRGWRSPLSADLLPRFYYIHKPHGSPESKHPGVQPTGPLPASVDFPLTPQEEPDRFQAILFGDTQPRNQQEIDYIAHDVIEELIGSKAAFGVTLGDIVFDDLSLMEPLSRTIALVGIPWYNVIGNHDVNRDARNRQSANETFERVYGPSYYSFDYGPVHFLVLDDINWQFDERAEKGDYQKNFGPEQIAFIKRDLELLPPEQMVVLMMHVPLVDAEDRREIYRLIEQRPFCISLSGHTHHHEHRFITEADGWRGPKPHHHIINVTVCGSTFKGAPDERGIPHAVMSDGAPNGYSLLEFDGQEYRLEFVPAGRSRDYQMQIYAPDKVALNQLTETEVLANIFNGSDRSVVEFRIGSGPWRPMTRTPVPDPGLAATYEREKKLLELKEGAWLLAQKPGISPHIWSGKLPPNLTAGTQAIEVRTRDMFHAEHHARRVIRIVP